MSPSDLAAHEKREFASEIKFLLDPATAGLIRTWARERLVADPNAQGFTGDTYSVTSIFLDTAGLDVFHRRGVHCHSKFRVRRYNSANFFFERKLKIRGRLAKRRTAVTSEDIARLSTSAIPAQWPGRWFAERIYGRRLQPQCQIDYQRTARVLMTPAGPIRLTLDENICARPTTEIEFTDRAPALPVTDRVILELKYRRDLPALFRELAERFALNPVSFSKYCAALPALGLVPSAALEIAHAEKTQKCQTS